jgi:chemotaxis signal transduction protein
MIVLHRARGPIGIIVASVRGIVPVTSSQRLDISKERTFLGCATGAIEVDGDLIHLLSADALLQVNEDRILADFSAMSQARLLQLELTPTAENTR